MSIYPPLTTSTVGGGALLTIVVCTGARCAADVDAKQPIKNAAATKVMVVFIVI